MSCDMQAGDVLGSACSCGHLVAVHSPELGCALCQPWPNEALIVESGECLVISMPNLSAHQQDGFMAVFRAALESAGMEDRALVVFGAEALAVIKSRE